ncbi:MAG: putative quinol monooxygenase [Hyphomicrobiales bacterium]|nr:putative quinol monooxygenase [Hyphomicrobiales bacterium]
MSEPLTLVAIITAKPGQEEELGRRLSALVAPTRLEPGCLNYDLHRSSDDPAVFMLYENWRSKADLDAHFEMPYLKDFLARMDEVLATDMDIRFFARMSGEPAKP